MQYLSLQFFIKGSTIGRPTAISVLPKYHRYKYLMYRDTLYFWYKYQKYRISAVLLEESTESIEYPRYFLKKYRKYREQAMLFWKGTESIEYRRYFLKKCQKYWVPAILFEEIPKVLIIRYFSQMYRNYDSR